MEEVLLEQQLEHRFMEEAIAEARKALELMEVPVGAVIVRDAGFTEVEPDSVTVVAVPGQPA